MGHSKWLLLLLIPMLFGFDTRNPFRTRGPFKTDNFTIGGGVVSSETRCQELGTSCIASEPLDTSTYQYVIPGSETDNGSCTTWTGSVYYDIDFGDSEGTGSKEIDRWYDCRGKTSVAASSTPVPFGSTQTWVLRSDLAAGEFIEAASSLPTNLKRVCERSYRRYDTNYVSSGTCAGDKVMETWSFNGTNIQMQAWNHNGRERFQFWVSPWSNGGTNQYPAESGTDNEIGPADCMDNWCRMELCLSTTDSNVRNLTNITLTAYATQVGVDSPLMATWTKVLGNSSGGSSLAELWPITIYRNDPAGSCSNDPATYGYSYHSHAMVAGWTTDSGQTIGAACEVEGGC